MCGLLRDPAGFAARAYAARGCGALRFGSLRTGGRAGVGGELNRLNRLAIGPPFTNLLLDVALQGSFTPGFHVWLTIRCWMLRCKVTSGLGFTCTARSVAGHCQPLNERYLTRFQYKELSAYER